MKMSFNDSLVKQAISEIFARIKEGESKKQAMAEVILFHEFDATLARKVIEGTEKLLANFVSESATYVAKLAKHSRETAETFGRLGKEELLSKDDVLAKVNKDLHKLTVRQRPYVDYNR